MQGDLAEIEALARRVEAFLAGRAGNPAAVFDLNVAIEEILANVIVHGGPRTGRAPITVTLTQDGRDAVAEIADEGAAHDPFQAPPPNLAATLEDRPVGGLGVHLVRTLVDAFGYRREAGRNIVTLRKTLFQAP
jgi:anti-sigma regulatory factor (Ser/Thr protein kinase)